MPFPFARSAPALTTVLRSEACEPFSIDPLTTALSATVARTRGDGELMSSRARRTAAMMAAAITTCWRIGPDFRRRR
jgi:hypothetical protein